MEDDVLEAWEAGVLETVKYLLPKLPYNGLAPALWSLRDMPFVGQDKVVIWVLNNCQPSMVYYLNVDVRAPVFHNYGSWDDRPSDDIEPGEVVCLIKQDKPMENGIWVYTGLGKPLVR